MKMVRRMEEGYRGSLPLQPGAGDAVRAFAQRSPLGLASSANREIIDLVLGLAGFGDAFRVNKAHPAGGADTIGSPERCDA